MNFTDVLKAVFNGLLAPFKAIFTSKDYQKSALQLLQTAEGNTVLALVQAVEGSDLSSDTLRGIVLAKAAAILTTQGVSLAVSEIDLLIATSVSYMKGKFGDHKIEVNQHVTDVVTQALLKI